MIRLSSTETLKQRGSLKEDGNKNNAYTENQKEDFLGHLMRP